MDPYRGTEVEAGIYVKALPTGERFPLNYGLEAIFKKFRITTMFAALQHASKELGDSTCMTTRKLLARQKEEIDGKLIERLALGSYSSVSYDEVLQMTISLGCWLRKNGFNAFDKVGIFAETRAEFLITALGCQSQRVTMCTVYTTLSDDAIVHALNEIEVKLLFTSFDQWPRVRKLLSQCPVISEVVVMEDQIEKFDEFTNSGPVKVIPYSEVTDTVNIDNDLLKVSHNPDDTALIMYTSGSTGNPKGVLLTNANIISSVIAFSCQVNVGIHDRYLAYLPLAHILEFATEICMISLRIPIFYSSPFTMTSTGSKIAPGTVGDAKLARPTYINAVPLMLDKIIKGVTSAVERQGRLKCMIFKAAVNYHRLWKRLPIVASFIDKIVFTKVREELGGQLKRVVCGGAPLSPITHENFRTIFGVTLQVGFAATETTSCGAGMVEEDNSLGNCGGPCQSIYMKLVDWDEGNYRTTDRPNPRGEVVLGGHTIAKGYYKLPKDTEKVFFMDKGIRWFRTGDIGEINSKGVLKIIDRKKDLVKLNHGEYISLGNAEAKLKAMSVVDNMCIFADPTKDRTVAVIVPVIEVLQKIALSMGFQIETMTMKDLCDEERIVSTVLKEMQKYGRRCGLSRWEIPAALHITNKLWTPDTGLVTAALKLRRPQLGQQYQAMIKDMYASLAD